MEFLLDFLYAFGIGIAFIIGSACTATLWGYYSRKASADFTKNQHAYNLMAEKRLKGYVANTGRIADSLEKLADKYCN